MLQGLRRADSDSNDLVFKGPKGAPFDAKNFAQRGWQKILTKLQCFPLFPIESADEIFAQLDHAFTDHESVRETSVELQHPGPSIWAYAQAWAQQAVY